MAHSWHAGHTQLQRGTGEESLLVVLRLLHNRGRSAIGIVRRGDAARHLPNMAYNSISDYKMLARR